MTNYEKIRQACIKANPKLLELSFGCEVSVFGVEYHHLYDTSSGCHVYSEEKDMRRIVKHDEFEILGHEPQLSDVLIALGQDIAIVGNKNGKACFLQWGQPPLGVTGTRGYWNYSDICYDLTKPLKDQSEELLQFIADLL